MSSLEVSSKASGIRGDTLANESDIGEVSMSPAEERRRRRRLPLKWPVRLGRKAGGREVEAETVNVSCEGLYCLSKESFTAGEKLSVTLVLPGILIDGDRPMELHGKAVVLRVEHHHQEEHFGIACKLEDYTFAPIWSSHLR